MTPLAQAIIEAMVDRECMLADVKRAVEASDERPSA